MIPVFTGKMQHVGRTGAPGGVRYTAHENGLMAEDYTQDVISTYTAIQEAKQQLLQKPNPPRQDQRLLSSQTLEQFYEQADNYYPPNRPKYPSFDRTRIQSAPSGARVQPQATIEKRAMSAKWVSFIIIMLTYSMLDIWNKLKCKFVLNLVSSGSPAIWVIWKAHWKKISNLL